MARVIETVANVATILLGLSATAILVERVLPPQARKSAAANLTLVSNWDSLLSRSVAHSRGSPGGHIVLSFTDLECPYCERHYRAVQEFFSQDSLNIAFKFVHLPLSGIHRFARPAAIASECAGEQGRLFEFVDVVFSKRDSLGLKTWNSFAEDSGIRDTLLFSMCLAANKSERIDRGVAHAERLGLSGTPSVLINGYLLSPTPSAEKMKLILDSLSRTPAPRSVNE